MRRRFRSERVRRVRSPRDNLDSTPTQSSADRRSLILHALAPHIDDEGRPNQVLLGGIVVSEPEPSRSLAGDPTTVLLVAFQESGEERNWGTSCAEVEVLDGLIEPWRQSLRPGAGCFLAGELMGSGYIWANLIALD